MSVKKGDFIEIDFTARADNEIFDTTNQSIAKKRGYKKEVKPIRIIVGERMVIEGLDKELEGKEIGRDYKIIVEPKAGFGERKGELTRVVSVNAFKDKRMLQEGNSLIIEGVLAKVVKVGSGRVLLDFNHPLAGKILTYDIKILKIIEDEREKLEAILDYYKAKGKIENNGKETILKLKDKNPEIEKIIEKYLKNVKIFLEK